MAVDEARSLVVTTGMTVSEQAVGTNAALLMKHKGTGVFPDNMTPAQAGQIARLALAYGLDPFAGELILHSGRPYLTIDGRLRVANSHPAFRGLECVPATDEERKAFRCRENEHLWKATVWRSDRHVPTTAYGRASDDDGNPVSKKWAQEMASKRARHRALRDAFSIPLPGREEAGDHDAFESAPHLGVIDVTSVDTTIMATPEQVTAIHTLVSALKWSDEEYRAVLQQTYGVASSKELAEGQAASVLEMLAILEEQGTAAAFIAQFNRQKAEVEARIGKPLRDLAWDDGELGPGYGGPSATSAEEPTDTAQPVDDATGVVLCTKAQRERLERAASPSALKTIDWATFSMDDAAMMLESLGQKA